MACKFFVKIASVTESESFVILNTAATKTFTDKQRVCFKIPTAVTSASAALPVYITCNGANTPILNKYGNPMTGAELKKNKCYCGFYGATTSHVIISNSPIECMIRS